MSKNNIKSPEEKEIIIKRYLNGESTTKLADEFNVSRRRIYYWVKDYEEKGNEQAMDQFVLKHYPKIYQYCLLRVRDHGYAEDLTQETFLKFFQAFERYKHYGKALNYLYVIAGNLCKDHFRKEGRMEVYEMSEEIAVEHMGQVEKRMEIYEALDKLPEEIREVVILFFFQEISQKEIARMMGIKLSLVKYRVSRAKKLLAKYLGEGE